MVKKIKIKRGLKKDLPTLDLGEYGLTTDESKVYIGGVEGNVGLVTDKELNQVNTNLAQQLAQTEQKIPIVANSKEKLSILSPYSHYENIHPKVLYFENGWRGFKFWMAYTPYKNADIKEENPCIAVSNDGNSWTIPNGLTNPIENWSGLNTQYNNDTHLVYRSDLNRLEVWFRTADTNAGKGYLKRKVSTDGVTWSSTETLYQGNIETDDHISPAVIYENAKYKMLSVYRLNSKWTVHYRESTDGLAWSTRQNIAINLQPNLQLWHLDFIKSGNDYEMIATGFDSNKGETTNKSNLYYSSSKDLINWSPPQLILRPSGVQGAFDGQGIYRSTIVKVGTKYFLYYSGVGLNAERGIALAVGDSPMNMIGENIVSRSATVRIKDVNGADLVPDKNIINKLDIKQGTSPIRYGHMGMGVLFLEDRLTNTTTPKNGAIGYSALLDTIQRYSGGSWRGLNTTAFYKKTTTQNLTSGTLSTIVFNSVLTTSSKYNVSTGIYTPAGEEYLKISVGVTIADAIEGDVELLLVNSSDAVIGYLQRKKIQSTGGSEYLNGQFVLAVLEPFRIAVKYTGANTPRITQYSTQNYLLIENI